MYGYIRQGRRTALTRETIGGVPFWVLTAGRGRLRRQGVRRLLRRMARGGVKTAVFEDDAWQAAAAKYGIRPPPVQALRLCKLEELLDCVCPRGLQGQAVRLHTGEDGAAARRAAQVLARRARYVALEPPGQTGLERWLLAQYGLAAGCCGHTPAVTVHLGPAPEKLDAAVYLGPDCAARQQVTYAAPGLGPWPVTEQLLAALTAAEQWEPSEIHVVSVTSRA